MPGVPDARCSWLWPNTTPWLPLDRHWPWPPAHPAESYTAAAADITTSTPAGLTTRTCYESRHPSCVDTPKYRTNEAINDPSAGPYAALVATPAGSERKTSWITFAGLTAAALRRTSLGSESRNTFFHAEPTCL